MAPEWSFLHIMCAPVSQTLQASVSHDSTRDADLLVLLDMMLRDKL